MADQILFDKLVFIDRPKRAGIDDAQARAHAEAMDEALRESVATKSDIDLLKNTVQSEVARLENTVQSEVARLGNTLQSEVARLGNAIQSEATRLENKLQSETARLENKIELAVRDMTVRMGAIAVALFAALASIKFFG
jgi:hypothetical protein